MGLAVGILVFAIVATGLSALLLGPQASTTRALLLMGLVIASLYGLFAIATVLARTRGFPAGPTLAVELGALLLTLALWRPSWLREAPYLRRVRESQGDRTMIVIYLILSLVFIALAVAGASFVGDAWYQ